MKSTLFKITTSAIFALLGIAVLTGGQSIPEAPAGFDGLTNGSVPQDMMNTALATFSEAESPNDGLGPVYNGTSCAECHQNMAIGGGTQVTVLRAGHLSRGEHANDGYFNGMKRGHDTNGSSPSFTAAAAQMANGTIIPDRSLINQRALCSDAQEHVTADDPTRTARMSLSILGDGFVEAVPDATLLALAAKNGGQAIMVPVLEAPNTTEVGRFGWKDQHASLLSFAGDAYLNEMGITNELLPDEVTTVCEPPNVSHPNDVDRDLPNLATFMRATKVPPRGPITADGVRGQAIFESMGCASCHVSTLVTAPAGTAIHGGLYTVPAALGGKQFHPYSDFLLHDIGTGDGIQQNGPPESINKMRTTPLWGVRTRTQLLHDGSAGTYDEAIQRHDHEAGDAAKAYKRLSQSDRQLLYQFLGSL